MIVGTMLTLPSDLHVGAEQLTVTDATCTVTIGDNTIPAFVLDSRLMIAAEQLSTYGWSVIAYSDGYVYVQPDDSRNVSLVKLDGPTLGSSPLKSEETVYVGDMAVESHCFGEYHLIPVDAFAAASGGIFTRDFDGNVTVRIPGFAPADPDAQSTPTEPLGWVEKLAVACSDAIAKHESELVINLPTLDYESINELLSPFNPSIEHWTQLAWVSRLSYSSQTNADFTISFEYIADTDMIDAVDSVVDDIVADALTLPTEYERVKYVHDLVCMMTVYDYGYADELEADGYYLQPRYHVPGVILDGKAVCQGYAETMEYILNKCGIECITVSGSAGGESHAWNVVTIDGERYFLDATWDDPKDGGISYRYFLRTTADMNRTHTLDDPSALPELTATRCNYYRKNGLYFDTYSKDALVPTLLDAIRDKRDIEYEFSSPSEAAKCRAELFTGHGVQSLLREVGLESQTVWALFADDSPYFGFCFSKLK